MSDVTICDRCEKVITLSCATETTIFAAKLYDMKIDLCPNCGTDFRNMFKEWLAKGLPKVRA